MMLHGLDYLHKNGIIFRDLNCGRIYYNNNNGVVSIGDLFVACPLLYEFLNEKEYGKIRFIFRNFPSKLYGPRNNSE
jgi:serine/threonine protein kinase